MAPSRTAWAISTMVASPSGRLITVRLKYMAIASAEMAPIGPKKYGHAWVRTSERLASIITWVTCHLELEGGKSRIADGANFEPSTMPTFLADGQGRDQSGLAEAAVARWKISQRTCSTAPDTRIR
jgi:hypothetical protein